MDSPTLFYAAVPAPPRRSSSRLDFWNFSIRELLLLTATAAALVAVFLAYYRDSRPFEQSSLPQDFGSGKQIRSAAAPLQSSTVIVNGGGGGSGDPHAWSREYQFTIGLTPAARGQFMTRLHDDARRMLDQDRPHYHGGADGGSDLAGFSYRYQGGGSRGVIVVRRVDVSDEEMHLSVLIYEHPDR